MNQKQMKLVSHALGIDLYKSVMSNKLKDKKLPKEFYRNYYNTEADSFKHKIVIQLCDLGIMEFVKRGYYRVTEAGIKLFKDEYKSYAIYIPRGTVSLSYLKHKINFYCTFFYYDFGGDNSNHIIKKYLEYRSGFYVSHTTEDCIRAFKKELKRYYKVGLIK